MSTVLRSLIRKNNICSVRLAALRTFSSSPNEKHILCSNISVDIPDQTIPEYIFSRTDRFSKYTAIECPLTGKSFTFGQIRLKSRNFGKSLRKRLKLEKGDVVAILLTNCPEFPIAALGIFEAGLVLIALNPLYTPDEVAKQFKDAKPKAVVTKDELHSNVKQALGKVQENIPILVIKSKSSNSVPQGAISFDEFTNEHVDYPDFQPNDPSELAFLPYSSGTTGLPKGVLLSHKNIVSNMHQADHPSIQLIDNPDGTYQSIVPAVLPWFHISGFIVNLLDVYIQGGRILPLPRFSPDTYISMLKKYDVTTIYAAPPLILFLTGHPDVRSNDLKSVKSVMSGAAPLGISDEDRFLEKAGHPIHLVQGYGLTEASPVLTMVTKNLAQTRKGGGSIGSPIPNTKIKLVAVDDSTGTPLGPNQTGELWAKGPQVMKGYHNRPEETQKTLTEDGWLKTGDMAYYNEEGLLYITDRLKELIKVKGFQVPPAELEEVIRSFPDISDAAVIGLPHSTYGEVPRAFVVPKPNKNIDVDELNQFVSEKVAPYKQLRGGITIVDSIPKNPSGKILRRELRLKYAHQ